MATRFYCETHKLTLVVEGKRVKVTVKGSLPPCVLLRMKPDKLKAGRFGACVVVEK